MLRCKDAMNILKILKKGRIVGQNNIRLASSESRDSLIFPVNVVWDTERREYKLRLSVSDIMEL